MSIAVESGIPTPSGRSGYPFQAMEIGDSFFVAANAEANKKLATTIGAAARNFSKKHATKFTIRLVEKGVRCWRVV